MLEDVLGWIIVLIGAVVIKFTELVVIDPIMSILVAIYIFMHAIKNLKVALYLFLEKTPNDINIEKIKEDLLKIKNIIDVHHIHIWSIDGYNNYATMHIVSDDDSIKVKQEVRNKLKEYKISHVTIEIENTKERCEDKYCHVENNEIAHHHHH